MTQYGRVAACKQLTLPPGQGCSAWLVQMSDLEEATWLVENLNRNIPTGFTEPVEVRFYPNILTARVGLLVDPRRTEPAVSGRPGSPTPRRGPPGRAPGRRRRRGRRAARGDAGPSQIGDRAPHELSSVSRRASRREPRGLLTYCNQEKIK
eukprot:CAMPEP_0175497656 /NCGR_PEP_ID=MMETSP0096-20121207/4917_1 /TAXON_ID=311494 /ORGANISM="Alexandrium monilatum, Strain CCMP3105" /LENGTH=150 /DNA_ID=CAMNT_0016799671 /DNA_START=57 /DNA_END=507 /DNA_ORIENTATION=-